MKVAIVGSRNYSYIMAVVRYVAALPKDTIIVSGGARGVDRAAELTAKNNGLAVLVFHPDWKTLGYKAGFARNKNIIEAADRVVAFWDGHSNGTLHSITLAKRLEKPLEVFTT